jgi:26S proteasome regulatory subunit N1
MLHIISEHIEVEKQKEEEAKEPAEPEAADKNANPHQSAAVLAVALIAFGEEIGTDMAKRQMAYMLQYGEPMIKQTVPLALALLGITKPDNALMDQLTKLAYDADGEVSLNAILSMGLIWSGTNNSRLAANLRSLASYNKDPNNLFMVRIA